MVHCLAHIAVTAAMLTLTRGIRNPDRMEKAILMAVPVGSDLARASRFMDSQGFRRGFGFGLGYAKSGNVVTAAGASRYVICFREDRLRPLGTMKWKVTLFHRGGVVTAVQVEDELALP